MKTIIKKAKLLPWTNPYVTDGLIAMWDGEWNAGIAKHDPNATTWIDLVNGHIGVKAADTVQWLKKACSIDNGYFIVEILPDSIKDAMNADTFTWEVCRNYRSGTGQYTLLASTDMRNEFWPTSSGTGCYLSWHSPSFTHYCSVDTRKAKETNSFVIDGNTVTGYGSGALYSTGHFTPDGTIIDASLELGSKRGITADIYSIRIYSRALSTAEIAANYAIDKMRFDL